MKERIKEVQEHYNLKQKQFALELGVAEATLSSVKTGRTAPSNNLIQAIHNAYPAININWLMFGEGEMLLPLTPETAVGTIPSAEALDRAAGVAPMTQAGIGQNVGFQPSEGPSLFDAPAVVNSPKIGAKPANYSALPTELQLAEALSQLKKANEVDRRVRKIKEIRVFFDDGTFEAFVPSNK